MARINGSGFKMKQSPVKGKLSNFFSSLGSQLKAGQKDRGIFSEKGKAEKKSRKAGESKYQADIRRRGEANKSAKAKKKLKPGEFTTKQKLEGNLVPNQELMNTKVKKAPKPEEATKPDWSKAPKVGTTARTNWYKKFNLALDETTPGYKSSKVNKVKKKKINAKTIKQDIAPTPGPLDPKYMPKTGDKELTLEDFKRITKPRNESMGGLQSTYIGKPIIDPLIKQSMKLSGKGLNSLFEGEPEPEIRSGIRKKSPSKKKRYKMKRKK